MRSIRSHHTVRGSIVTSLHRSHPRLALLLVGLLQFDVPAHPGMFVHRMLISIEQVEVTVSLTRLREQREKSRRQHAQERLCESPAQTP